MASSKFLMRFFSLIFILFSLAACNKKNVPATENITANYPQRIVALSPASTEILYAIGAENQIVAVSAFADYPPEALNKPKAGSFDASALSIESIMSFNPDFVYLTDGMHNFLIESLETFNIPYYLSKSTSIKDVKDEIAYIGNVTGHAEQAEKVVLDIENTIKEAAANNSSSKVSVYYEVWNNPYMSAGSSSFINDVIQTSGASNIFSSEDAAYPIVSEESIIARQPQVVLIPRSSFVTEAQVVLRTGWETIPAVMNNQIFIVDDNLFTRPGPRIGQAVSILADILEDKAE